MAARHWLVVRLPKGTLREHAHTLGNLLFAQLHFAALARENLPVRQRHTFTLFCDEVQNLAENDLNTLLTEGRKFGVSVVTANQFWEQLPKELRGALLSAASHICFRVSSQDAATLAPELSLERRGRLTVQLTQLDRGEAIGRFGAKYLHQLRVEALPARPAVTAGELDRAVAPVTRDREDIERRLRHTDADGTPDTRSQSAGQVTRIREGHHDW